MRMIRLVRALVVLCVLGNGLGPGSTGAQETAPLVLPLPVTSQMEPGTLRETPCPFPLGPNEVEGETAYCVVFAVPQDWSDAASGSIELMTLVKKATGPNALPDPVVLLVGGPGESAIIAGAMDQGQRLRETRDLIFPAMRGTLFSQRLDVEECAGLIGAAIGSSDAAVATMTALLPTGTPDPATLADLEAGVAAVEQATDALFGTCFDAFEAAGLDVTQFSSKNAARDVVELMAALGYDAYNLHGVSYGARLALRILNDYPEAGVRSAVLDSAPVSSVKEAVDFVRAPYLATQRVFADCAADAACNAAYPSIWERTVRVIQTLDTTPIVDEGGPVTGADVVAVLSDRSNTRPIFFPAMIAELERGETGLLRSLANGQIGLFPAGTPGATTIVQRFVSSIVMYATSPTDPLASFGVLLLLGSALGEENPEDAVRAAVADTFDGDAERDLLGQLDVFTGDDWAGIALLLGAQSGDAGATPAPAQAGNTGAVPLLAKNTAFFLMSVITCGEYAGDTRLDDVESTYASLDEPRLALPRQSAVSEFVCSSVPAMTPDPIAYGPVSSDVPVLLLHGEIDPKIPPDTVALLQDQLANETLVFVPAAGHNVWTQETGCVADIAISFIDQPDVAPAVECLDAMRYQFVLPVDDHAENGTPES